MDELKFATERQAQEPWQAGEARPGVALASGPRPGGRRRLRPRDGGQRQALPAAEGSPGHRRRRQRRRSTLLVAPMRSVLEPIPAGKRPLGRLVVAYARATSQAAPARDRRDERGAVGSPLHGRSRGTGRPLVRGLRLLRPQAGDRVGGRRHADREVVRRRPAGLLGEGPRPVHRGVGRRQPPQGEAGACS